MQADLVTYNLWGSKPWWGAPLITFFTGSWQEHHVCLHIYGTDLDALLHLGLLGTPSKLIKYKTFSKLMGNPYRRVNIGEVSLEAADEALHKHRSPVWREVLYLLFSKGKGVMPLFNMKQKINCTTLTRDVLRDSGYDISTDIYFPCELREAVT